MPAEISNKTNIEMPNFWVVIVMQNSWVAILFYTTQQTNMQTQRKKNKYKDKQANKQRKKCEMPITFLVYIDNMKTNRPTDTQTGTSIDYL